MKTNFGKTKKTFSFLMIIVVAIEMLFCVPTASAKASEGKWITSWGTAPVNYYISLAEYVPNFFVNGKFNAGTLTRTEIAVSAAGEKLRLKFSNEYGDKDVSFANVNVARTDTSKKGAIDKYSVVPLTFGGSSRAVIPAGGEIWSDAIDFKTKALEKVTVSIYYDKETPVKTAGLFFGNTYCAPALSDAVDDSTMIGDFEITIATGVNAYHVIPFLTTVESYTSDSDAYSVVFIGDSTLVNSATEYLSARLTDAGEQSIALVNECLMGNRLFYEGHGLIGNLYGDAVVDRFERDVLNITGCKTVIVKIGVNDILHPSSKSMGGEAPYVSAQEIINGYKKLAERAHEKGMRIYFMEITPWNGYVRDILGLRGDIVWQEELQQMCDECNEWIRTNTVADGYVDSSVLAKPDDYTSFRVQFTKDGIHLSNTGALAFADCFDLDEIFGVQNARTAAEIYGINPYGYDVNDTINKILLKFKNVFVFLRQLFSALRLEYDPIQKALDKIIDSFPVSAIQR